MPSAIPEKYIHRESYYSEYTDVQFGPMMVPACVAPGENHGYVCLDDICGMVLKKYLSDFVSEDKIKQLIGEVCTKIGLENHKAHYLGRDDMGDEATYCHPVVANYLLDEITPGSFGEPQDWAGAWIACGKKVGSYYNYLSDAGWLSR